MKLFKRSISDRLFWYFSARGNKLKYLFKPGIDFFAPDWIKTIKRIWH